MRIFREDEDREDEQDTESCELSMDGIKGCLNDNGIGYDEDEDGCVTVGSLCLKEEDGLINVTYDGEDFYSYIYLDESDPSSSSFSVNKEEKGIEIYRNFTGENGDMKIACIVVKNAF